MIWSFLVKLVVGDVVVTLVFSLGITALIAAQGAAMVRSKNRGGGLVVVMPLMLAAAAFQAYLWAGWSAYCALLAHRFVAEPTVAAYWLYWVTGFAACTAPLSYLLNAERVAAPASDGDERRRNLGGTFYTLVAIAAFAIFAFWPSTADRPFGWLLRHFI